MYTWVGSQSGNRLVISGGGGGGGSLKQQRDVGWERNST